MTAFAFLPRNIEEVESAVSSGGAYLKLKEGDKFRLRILGPSPFLAGFEWWTQANRPCHSLEHPGRPADIRTDRDGKPDRVRAFWAMIVWNFDEERVQIWSITQATIRDRLLELFEDQEDWGAPTEYDITVSRTGSGLDTEYSVVPGKPRDIPADAIQGWRAINVEALLGDENPFADYKAGTPHRIDWVRWRGIRCTLADLIERAGTEAKLGKASEWAFSRLRSTAAPPEADDVIERMIADALAELSASAESTSGEGVEPHPLPQAATESTAAEAEAVDIDDIPF